MISCIVPVLRPVLGEGAPQGVVVEDLALLAAELADVLGEVARDELLARGGVRETGVRQGLRKIVQCYCT